MSKAATLYIYIYIYTKISILISERCGLPQRKFITYMKNKQHDVTKEIRVYNVDFAEFCL